MNFKQLFLKYWQNLEIEAIVGKVFMCLIEIIITFIILTLIYRLIHHSVALYFDRAAKRDSKPQRHWTLKRLVLNIIHYTYFFILVYSLLAILGIPVATLMAGAGVASIAIGIGAQGFVNDIVNGFFILLEHQFDVSDAVIINGYEGSIYQLGMRTTVIKDWEGQMHYISNRNITDVTNLSRNPLRIDIDIEIYPDTDTKKMKETIHQKLQILAPHPLLSKEPLNLGIYTDNSGRLIYRLRLFSSIDNMVQAKSLYYQEMMSALKAENIPIPGNQAFLRELLEARNYCKST